MTAPDIVGRLAQHRTLRAAPREELEWMAARGRLWDLQAGDRPSTADLPVHGLYVLLSGRIVLYVDHGSGPQREMEWRAGDVTGLLPYSRMTKAPGNSIAEEPTTFFELPAEHFPALIRECHGVTSILVHSMLDRARAFKSKDLHDEKMVSLGKLSAGLAHELNNPASAIERSASLLGRRLEESEQAARALGAAHLTDAQLLAVDTLRGVCTARVPHRVLSPIQHAERENEIIDWLVDHGIDESIGEPLAETAITTDALNGLASVVTGPALTAVLHWAATGCVVRELAGEIEEAAERISSLVSAIKGFTHMDQAAVAEPVDLAVGLGNTIAVLKSKARNKMISVEIHIEPGLPRVLGFGGELNQVWANLIDNALDAAPNSGLVVIIANRDRNRVVVRVSDNGAGIPENIVNNIFDPFFTTKPVGQGTGLGLDIVRQLLRHNSGDIVVETTRPGQTTFRVSLPMAEPQETTQ